MFFVIFLMARAESDGQSADAAELEVEGGSEGGDGGERGGRRRGGEGRGGGGGGRGGGVIAIPFGGPGSNTVKF